jgi:tetratricopeptide (TPR) repeat protein
MTKGAKIGCGIAALVGFGLICSLSLTIHALVNFNNGMTLGREGYTALMAADYDRAIERLDAALQKHLTKSWRAWAYLSRGSAFNHKSRFDDAIRDFTEALRLNANLTDAYAGRGWAYQQKGEIGKAMEDLTETIRRDPNSRSAYYDRGLIFYERKELDRAISDFNESVRCNPNQADGFVMRGICLAAKNDLDPALASFDAAIAIAPTNAKAFAERGYLYERRGDKGKSEHDLAEARRLAPAWTRSGSASKTRRSGNVLEKDAHLDWAPLPSSGTQSLSTTGKSGSELINEARIAYDLGQFDRAVDLDSSALAMKLSPGEASVAAMNRGNAYRAKRDLGRAMHDYDEAIALDLKNAGAYVNRAVVFAHYHEHEKAIKDLTEAIRLNPKQWEAYLNRAADFRDEKRFDEAIADLGKTIELNSGFVRAYTNRAAIYFQKQEIDKALQDCTKAIEIDPDSDLAYISRAKIYLYKKQFEEAERDLEKSSQLKSKRPDLTLNSLAWLLATCPEPRMRNGKKAIETATKACDLKQWKNWRHIDTLAAAYAETGDFEVAIKYETQALQTAPEGDDVAGARERLQLFQHHKPYREKPKL